MASSLQSAGHRWALGAQLPSASKLAANRWARSLAVCSSVRSSPQISAGRAGRAFGLSFEQLMQARIVSPYFPSCIQFLDQVPLVCRYSIKKTQRLGEDCYPALLGSVVRAKGLFSFCPNFAALNSTITQATLNVASSSSGLSCVDNSSSRTLERRVGAWRVGTRLRMCEIMDTNTLKKAAMVVPIKSVNMTLGLLGIFDWLGACRMLKLERFFSLKARSMRVLLDALRVVLRNCGETGRACD